MNYDFIIVGAERIPFLICSLVSHDNEQQAVVAAHVRWLERFLANFKKQAAVDSERWKRGTVSEYPTKPEDIPFWGWAFILQETWNERSDLNELEGQRKRKFTS